jgi:gas vesicle protein
MKNQPDFEETTDSSGNAVSSIVFLVAGLGIGAAMTLLLAPQSGAETRQWIANKCLDGVDTANKKVRRTRAQVRDILDDGQESISEAVSAGRAAVAKA